MEINFGGRGRERADSMGKGRGGGTGQGVHGFPCQLREMDFLNIPAKWYRPDATARDSPSGLIAGFW